MKELLHMRVFSLKGSRYQISFGSERQTIDEYYMSELEAGYLITGMQNYGIEKLLVTSYYSPERAKTQLEGKSAVSDLAEVPTEEV